LFLKPVADAFAAPGWYRWAWCLEQNAGH